MCGIVAGISTSDIKQTLLNGLSYLEYRGYDSAGISIIDNNNTLTTFKNVGKVKGLKDRVITNNKHQIGIAHTRWATHGKVNKQNAHPHISGERIAIVHNGIIENFSAIKKELEQQGYKHNSDTDSEVIAHLIHSNIKPNTTMFSAFKIAMKKLKGSFAVAAIDNNDKNTVYTITKDSPLVIGLSKDGNYVASDQIALLELTNKFMYLENNDIAILKINEVIIYDENGDIKKPKIHSTQINISNNSLDGHKHFMHKEIHYQHKMASTLIDAYLSDSNPFSDEKLQTCLRQVKQIKIIACGTSFNAGHVAKYWLEDIAEISTSVDIASEYRYKKNIHDDSTFLIYISQSGETADTLAVLRNTKNKLANLALCNESHSTMAREADFFININADKEIGVASTKAFTAQLICLLFLSLEFGKINGKDLNRIAKIKKEATQLPEQIKAVLAQEESISEIAKKLIAAENVIFLGRNVHYPIAQEGALKLKELSYLNANAYAAGELKHGPLALVDKNIYAIYILPNNFLLEKNLSNLEEIEARGGNIICVGELGVEERLKNTVTSLVLKKQCFELSPITINIPLQLLAYYVALYKGHDVDQPRNLAKSVTVE